MKISNKLDSIKMIKELGLNTFPEKVITAFGDQRELEVNDFIQTYPATYFTLRDKSKNGGKAFHAVKADEVLDAIKVYDGAFAILVSSFNYKDNQLLVGEVLIYGEKIHLLVSRNGEYSIRDLYKNPDICINTNIFDDKVIDEIPYFNEIYDFITQNKLFNVIVEFGYFNIPVGINSEKFIIYEIRTDY